MGKINFKIRKYDPELDADAKEGAKYVLEGARGTTYSKSKSGLLMSILESYGSIICDEESRADGPMIIEGEDGLPGEDYVFFLALSCLSGIHSQWTNYYRDVKSEIAAVKRERATLCNKIGKLLGEE